MSIFPSTLVILMQGNLYIKQPKILLIGKNGQLGWELKRTLAPIGQVIDLDRTQLDLTDVKQIRQQLRTIKPDFIVNAAAYTEVDGAEDDIAMATAINAMGPEILAEEAKRLGAFVIHYSTDFIFDGTQNKPYTENDIPNPLSVYGQAKLAGEKAIIASGAPYFIFRTSWVYGLRRKNFMLTILKLAREGKIIRVVDDQIGCPTWCRLIAELTSSVLAKGSSFLCEKQGIYHLTAGGQASRFDFAKAIIEKSLGIASDSIKLIPVPTTEFPTKAKRPAYSVLSNTKLLRTFGLILPKWDSSLDMVAEEISNMGN